MTCRMTRLFLMLLTLLFSLSGPAIGGYSDFGRSSVAAKTAGQLGQEGEAAIQAAAGLSKNTESFIVNKTKGQVFCSFKGQVFCSFLNLMDGSAKRSKPKGR